jgi:Tetratricopeptide repeat
MKLHLLQKLFSLMACVILASSGQCQKKADEIPLTGQQKADLERALTLNKQVGNLYNQGKYAEATPLALKALKIRREALGDKHPNTVNSINNLANLYDNQAQYAKNG